MSLRPLNDRIIVRVDKAEEVSKGGIFIPDSGQEKPQQATVISVGPGRLLPNGKIIALQIKVNDKILYGKYGGSVITIEDEEFLILTEQDVLAVVE